ncbi:hypothetical protein ScPMuIL_001340 [Solemya velum]
MEEHDGDIDPRQKFILGTSRSEDGFCGVISGLAVDNITTPLSTFSVTTTPNSEVCFLPGSHVHHGNRREMACINYRQEEPTPRCGCLRGMVNQMFPDGFKTECREMIQLTWPISAMAVLHYTVFAVSLVFCGHLGKERLGATALAITWQLFQPHHVSSGAFSLLSM